MKKNDTLNRINYFLDQKGWTIYRLAQKSDLSYSSLNNIFVRNTEPTIATLRKICSGLGITLYVFFEQDINEDTKNIQLSEEDMKLIENFHDLSDTDRSLLLAYAAGLAKKPMNR